MFRERDRCLIVGDAFVTTRQESLHAVATQTPEVNGPPACFTPDWPAARRSTRRSPRPAHGPPLRGEALRPGLAALAARFDERAVPAQGRYVR